jgi:hypothetical protein
MKSNHMFVAGLILLAGACNPTDKGGNGPQAGAGNSFSSAVTACGSKMSYSSTNGTEQTSAGSMRRININGAIAVCGAVSSDGKMPFKAEGMRVTEMPVVHTGKTGSSLADDGAHVLLNDQDEVFVLANGGSPTKIGDLPVEKADVGIKLLPGYSMQILVRGQPYSPDTTQPGDKFAPASEKAVAISGPGLD